MSCPLEPSIRIAVTCNRRLSQTPDGNVWTTSGDDYRFWTRYLSVFDGVLVVSRVKPAAEARAEWRAVNGPGVSVCALPDYQGPWGYGKTRFRVLQHLGLGVSRTDAVILRIPGHVATSLEVLLRLRGQPYGAEVVGDIGAALARGSLKHLARPILRFFFVRAVRRQCSGAKAISYVTSKTLQRMYPPAPSAFQTHYSSIELPDESIADQVKILDDAETVIVSAGSMERRYKRFDLLIGAVRQCAANGLSLRLVLIGDGRERSFFEELARPLEDRVEFLGELPGSDEVRAVLRESDLLVFPSMNEGLPRTVIEAMSVGLPCIATSVGGTPELLHPDDLVPPGDVNALASKIEKTLGDPVRFKEMSARNLKAARRYAASMLSPRREELYRSLKRQTCDHHRSL